MNPVPTITIQTLKDMRDNNDDFVLIDVREKDEWEFCRLHNAEFVPLSNFAALIDKYDRNKNYAILCKAGGRSASATEYMLRNGFKNVVNVAGGITAWATEIDKSVPTY
ncbi:MAG: rhodanese-like domain-containing protein [bacterium]|nr:rhodanese-like domain-containing protein [bacterium]